ncbi:MAG: Asp-tRNA(Asn)/Glu-tRNA(Gln) amidotransferase subunit GatA [Acidobacteriota bacterium]
MAELHELTAEQIAGAVTRGEASAVDVAQACLARIRRVDPSISAYLLVREADALDEAAELDRRRAAGEVLGPLAGVPVALKDNLSLSGGQVSCGSRVLEGYVSPYTATAVQRLIDAGAVMLGKTNLDEFAMGSSCENSAFHPTQNPWDLGMVPGGSSGGSAAAVAAATVPLALGSDTGGSVRQPAALCGVVGMKPTYGRVSRYGLVAFGSSLDQIGSLTRSVRDTALALGIMAGVDSRDTTSAAQPVDDYLDGIEAGIIGLRIGVVKEVHAEGLAADVQASWQSTLGTLRSLGAELVEVSIPNLRAAIAVYYVLANCEASANLARFDGVRYGHRAKDARDLRDLYLDSRSEGFGPEVKRRIMLGTFALSSGYYEAYYGRARGALEGLREQFAAAFRAVDVIATPTSPTGAFALGERVDDPLTMYLSDIFTVPANLVGLPGIAVPSGMDARALPLSLQLLGRPFGERTILRAARAFEAAVAWSAAPSFRGAPASVGGA